MHDASCLGGQAQNLGGIWLQASPSPLPQEALITTSEGRQANQRPNTSPHPPGRSFPNNFTGVGGEVVRKTSPGGGGGGGEVSRKTSPTHPGEVFPKTSQGRGGEVFGPTTPKCVVTKFATLPGEGGGEREVPGGVFGEVLCHRFCPGSSGERHQVTNEIRPSAREPKTIRC